MGDIIQKIHPNPQGSGETNRTGTKKCSGAVRDLDHAGFSLVELLVVVTILAILAAVAIPTFLNQRNKARDAETISNVKFLSTTLSSAVAASTAVNPPVLVNVSGVTPATFTVDGSSVGKGGAVVWATSNGSAWCVSQISPSGRIFTSRFEKVGVHETTTFCSSPTSTPTEGGNSGGGAVISAEGNLLPANVATGGDTLGNTTGFVAQTGAFTLAYTTAFSVSGGGSTQGTLTGATAFGFVTPVATGGTAVNSSSATFSVKLRSTPGQLLTARVQWRDSAGVVVGSFVGLPQVTADGTFQLIQGTLTKPAGATHANFYFGLNSGTAGTTFQIDEVGIWDGAGGTWAPPGQPILG